MMDASEGAFFSSLPEKPFGAAERDEEEEEEEEEEGIVNEEGLAKVRDWLGR